jgi:glycosyltransferase involved in cell wall biosynthesis
LGLTNTVEFTGWVGDEAIQRGLSSADICLAPDPMSPLNNVSTMTKVAEYMAMGQPIVAFDLAEERVSAGDAAVYVPCNDERAFALAIDELLKDPERRRRMGEVGRRRIEEQLSWDVSRRTLVAFYGRLTGPPVEPHRLVERLTRSD